MRKDVHNFQVLNILTGFSGFFSIFEDFPLLVLINKIAIKRIYIT